MGGQDLSLVTGGHWQGTPQLQYPNASPEGSRQLCKNFPGGGGGTGERRVCSGVIRASLWAPGGACRRLLSGGSRLNRAHRSLLHQKPPLTQDPTTEKGPPTQCGMGTPLKHLGTQDPCCWEDSGTREGLQAKGCKDVQERRSDSIVCM